MEVGFRSRNSLYIDLLRIDHVIVVSSNRSDFVLCVCLGSHATQDCEQCVLPVFNNLVVNERSNDVEAEVLKSRYILPPKSSFYMVCRLINWFSFGHIETSLASILLWFVLYHVEVRYGADSQSNSW